MRASGSRTEIWDYVDLALLRLAKIRRRKLAEGEDPGAFYGEFFNDNDAQIRASGGDPRRRYVGEVLREAAWAQMPPGARVLDVGCGAGDNLRYILRDQASFYGLEYAESTARVAQKMLTGKAQIMNGSATELQFEDDSFDLVVCLEVLEHIADAEKACSEIARVMKNRGALVLSLPFRRWFPAYYRLMGHFRHYTRPEVEEILQRYGLTVIQHLPNFPRWSRFANYIYVLCRIWTLVLRLFGVRRSPAEARLPFARRALMEVLFSWIDGIRASERSLDYAALETSTFVVARKVQAP